MGGSSFSHDDWVNTSKSFASKSTSQIYKTSSLKDDINPSKMKNMLRESCDSNANPNSTPIIIGLDFTGSMDQIPDYMIKTGLGNLFKEIYERKPVSDPQVLFCGIGDVAAGDPAPFQVGQFESQCDLLIEGLTKFWLNGCFGGGNNMESYDIPYYFAAKHTKTDSMLKRKQKGIIFTIGDEPPPSLLKALQIEKVFGYKPETDISFNEIIQEVSKSYIPYHIIIEQGHHPQHYGLNSVLRPWQKLLGERAIVCTDYTKISEIIVSILEVNSGKSIDQVINSWDKSTSLAVKTAITDLSPSTTNKSIVF